MKSIFATCFLSIGTAFAAYQEAPVNNGGSLAGKVVYDGVAPKPAKLTITQDPTVCGSTREETSLLVGSGGGVENVVVYLADISAGKKMVATAPAVLDQKDCHYTPGVQVVGVGGDLQIKNSDPILHNIHSYQAPEGTTVLNLAMPKQGMVITKKMKKAGGETLKCDIHSFMRGAIFVAENPYYAITDKDGNFEIKDIPAGTYTVTTFHETASPKSASITIAAGGKATFSPKIK